MKPPHPHPPLALARLPLSMGLAAPVAFAQAWPSKPVKVIVNFPPGGAADQLARAIGRRCRKRWASRWWWKTAPAPTATSAAKWWRSRRPTATRLLMSSGGMVSVNPHLYPQMAFDPAKDLVPVAAAARVLVYPGRQALHPRRQHQGLHRLREGQSRQAFLWLAGQRQLAAPGRRNVQEPGGPLRGARAVSRRGAGDAGPAGAASSTSTSTRASACSRSRPASSSCWRWAAPSAPRMFPDVPTLDEAGLKASTRTPCSASTHRPARRPTWSPA